MTVLEKTEIPYRDPIDVFASMADRPYAQLLHSCPGAAGGGRYSFIAFDPFDTLTTWDGVTRTQDGSALSGDPFSCLQNALGRFRAACSDESHSPFIGGALGYFGYELLHNLETIPRAETARFSLPDMDVGLYDTIAAYDHHTQRAWVLATGFPEKEERARRHRANHLTQKIADLLETESPKPLQPFYVNGASPKTTKADYIARVKRAIDYIYAGDIYQANLSQCFQTDLPATTPPYDVFRRMMTINPVSYAAYLNTPHATIISNSPERFLKVHATDHGHHVETRPIKGTRPRGESAPADHTLQEALAHSEKDRAENIMIVALLRNDLSKVCRDDSVNVSSLCEVETYATLHHLVSTITGTLKKDKDAVDLLKACFPGGSITGAPKVRAMEIITELEKETRGPYCGAIGYLGFDGGMDTNIAIRTLTIPHANYGRPRQMFYPVGGGIVADSDPDMEYEESLVKAKAFFAMLADMVDQGVR